LNLGSNTNRWNDIYLSNSTIYLGNATISANGTSIVVDSIIVGNNGPVGNIASINLNGNANSVLRGDGTWGADANSSYGDSNVVSLLSAFGSNTISTTGNISAGNIIGNGQALTGINGANVTGEVSYAAVANAVAGANVTGEVSYAVIANSVAGGNVSGEVAFAAVANVVAIANVSGIVLDQYTTYVGENGNDTTGNGTVINPYKTISKAVDTVGSGGVIIVSPGEYNEDVTINNKFAITISSETPGGRQPFTPSIYGNLTISGNSSSISFKGIGVQKGISHTSTGSVYMSEFQMGSGNTVGQLSKTGSGYLSMQNVSLDYISGGNITPVTISGPGAVVFSNVALGLLSVSNTSATVSMLSNSSSLQANISAGSLNIFDSVLYTLANSGSNAIVGTGGVISVRNSIAINPNQTTARLNVGPTTVLAYDDFYFDRPNSNVGIIANVAIDFQSLRLSNTITTSNVVASNNVSAKTLITTPITLSSLTAVAGSRSFISDANLVATGNWGAIVGGGGSNTVPVWSDGTNWYIG